jgi:hypothetical protein
MMPAPIIPMDTISFCNGRWTLPSRACYGPKTFVYSQSMITQAKVPQSLSAESREFSYIAIAC